MSRSAALLRAGRVGAPHGLDGSFHVLEARPPLLFLGAPLRLGGRELSVVRRAGTDQRPILRLEGVNDREAARSLRGSELLIARELAPELPEDEWWAEDLEGCVVRHGNTVVGRVQRVVALPSCEVLEIRRENGAELLVPLVSDAVGLIDTERGEIEVNLTFLEEA